MLHKDFIRVLYIDLTNEEYRFEERRDLFKYLGGTGVAAKLLEENIKPELDPLDPAQPIIFANGPLSFVMPVCTKVVATFYSPHTREYGESHAGGRLAMAMRFNNIDAIVITGRAKHPEYLVIDDKVLFKDARAMWGLSVEDTGKILRQHTSGSGIRSSMRIGRSGENLVSYAGVNVDTYRHFGRLGLGAVFGSKLLKGIVIIGDEPVKIPKENMKKYREVYDSIYDTVTKTDVMEKYHAVGTSINVLPLNEMNSLPSLNLQTTRYEHAENISGERFAKEVLVRKVACSGCQIGCIHIGQFRREFDDGYEYETVNVSYDHELVFALGSFVGLKNPEEVLQLIDVVEREGLDAISTGVALGWATEAYKRGIITIDDTLMPFEFGVLQNYMAAVHYIATGKNEFYRALGKGVDFASKKYGGQDFACHLGGNEMPGYHTGYGSVVGFSVGSRHSHLDNAGYSIDQARTKEDDIVKKIFEEELERNILTSLVICLFARKVYNRDTIIKALDAVGITLTNSELTEIAKEILRTKYRIKEKLGYSLDQIKIPKRFFKTITLNGKLDEEKANNMVKEYKAMIDELMK
ncbi:aldehyde ferredoxin oxidoreductase N-terminal domain-containing protein [Caloramator sp. CAR-1]|uniref:aldehyde ferredoxin oxidoreductase N-terminal domain-containing protein n=3 Tax=unclassified Caloramator TaxID=2629145 RepID=UPI0026E133AB|nr:aldehyde ferredoxin oxidoreductase N-terminal domain-containing protein [Caloramator sp. CAR-1]MDO6353577.1 aldehyde ferredoxin oxidoreductase N-terminal domain-containing protein [Caloramator sp. CAR-1]